MDDLVFLKLGGSLITDKTLAYTPRLKLLDDLAQQIAYVRQEQPGLGLVVGHGSGSFGHTAAKEFHTRDGIRPNPGEVEITNLAENKYWDGFAKVWFQASTLNHLVMEALYRAGLPAIALAPVAAIKAKNGKVLRWDLASLKAALAAHLLPVIYGDVVFDEQRGGTILSTEDLFEHLARELRPNRILLAGLEEAVWADYPANKQRVVRITPDTYEKISAKVGASHGADVTGGMESKVSQMLKLVEQNPEIQVHIFSGEKTGNLQRALFGEDLGTLLTAG